MILMRSPGTRAAVVVCLLTGLVATASAQSAPPYDPNVDVQLFEYAVGPKTFASVDDAHLAAAKQLAFDFMVTFLTNPVTIYNVSDDETQIEGTRTDVVKSMLAGEVSGAYGLNDKLQLGVTLPIIFSENGDGIDVMTAGKGSGLQVSGTGDLRGEVKAKLWENETMGLAGSAGLTLPTSFGSGGGDYLGDNLPTLRARAAWQWTGMEGKLSAGANAGFILRKPRTIYASTIGQQLTFGVAAAYSITDKFVLFGETFGRTGIPQFGDVDSSPVEAGGGLRVVATKAIAVTLGGDAGIVKGIGSPGLRVFASVGYEPDTRDSDGDGIANNKDHCPLVAEDKDHFQDSDGCPDDDNDGDKRADGEDKCPSEAEDFDGYEDDDGCPELDNDGDGIADLDDKCISDKEDGQAPNAKDGCPWDKRDSDDDTLMDNADQCPQQTEDADGFDDWDGCPELDNDLDGIPDENDKCPLCAEDKDNVEDDDGCPEFDADHDGITDASDKCPLEAEVINGVNDWDGCADEGGALVADFDGDRITFAAPVTFDKKGLTKAGTVILDQAALQMLSHPDVTLWTLAVTAKKDSDARKRAGWVVRYLVSKGVAPSVLHVLSEKGSDAVGVGVEERADAPDPDAAPECPAGMEATPKPHDAGASTTTPPPADDDVELGN
jgi:OOP family OmpA-OmpF porin